MQNSVAASHTARVCGRFQKCQDAGAPPTWDKGVRDAIRYSPMHVIVSNFVALDQAVLARVGSQNIWWRCAHCTCWSTMPAREPFASD